MRTGEGDWAIFDGVGSVPTTMTASRILLACKMLCPELIICQSDCESAYVQASLPDDVVTYVYLPKEWWPDSWFYNNDRNKPKYKNPVVRLRKALYGHPRAGDLWADKLAGVLKEEGFEPVSGWPSMYIRLRRGEAPIVVDVYVDDLIMLGTCVALGAILHRIRKVIKMEDPHELGKYLGCYHRSLRRSAKARGR